LSKFTPFLLDFTLQLVPIFFKFLSTHKFLIVIITVAEITKPNNEPIPK
jgi:hypothetical protein